MRKPLGEAQMRLSSASSPGGRGKVFRYSGSKDGEAIADGSSQAEEVGRERMHVFIGENPEWRHRIAGLGPLAIGDKAYKVVVGRREGVGANRAASSDMSEI